MKTCLGCKYLVGKHSCKAGEDLMQVVDPYTGVVTYRDRNNPDAILRPSPNTMRADGGACGPDRKLYEPTLWTRMTGGIFN